MIHKKTPFMEGEKRKVPNTKILRGDGNNAD